MVPIPGWENVNVEHLQLWIDALESGKYKQASGALEATDEHGATEGFCCMGVACQAAIGAGMMLSRYPRTGCAAYGVDHNAGYLPREVQDWLGIVDNNPVIWLEPVAARDLDDPDEDPAFEETTCSEANDRRGWSFAMIAARLREIRDAS